MEMHEQRDRGVLTSALHSPRWLGCTKAAGQRVRWTGLEDVGLGNSINSDSGI